jgi:hypothetical protein
MNPPHVDPENDSSNNRQQYSNPHSDKIHEQSEHQQWLF